METFLVSINNIASQMVRLREEAEISINHLMRLEEHLTVLHKITHREDEQVVPLYLKQFHGTHDPDLFERMYLDLDVLKNVDGYRKKALMYVVATLHTLHTLDADMEELRARVAVSDLLGDRIPIEVHIKSIGGGVERLKEGQVKSSLK